MFWLFFQTKNKKNTISKVRWAILKISNDLTELTDNGGGNLIKKKGKRLDSGCDEESDSQSAWDLWRGGFAVKWDALM